MAEPFEIVGLKELIARLDKAPARLIKEVDAELREGALAIEQEAVVNAPADDAFLRKGITSKKISLLRYSVQSNANISAYVEFGTGVFVDVPSGLEAYAMTFYINGEGTMKPHPFLFPAYFSESQNIIRNIKQVLKDL